MNVANAKVNYYMEVK